MGFGTKLLTPDEEKALARKVQRLVKWEGLRANLTESLGREPSRSWSGGGLQDRAGGRISRFLREGSTRLSKSESDHDQRELEIGRFHQQEGINIEVYIFKMSFKRVPLV